MPTGDYSPPDMRLSYFFQQSLVEVQKWFPFMLIVTKNLGNLSIPVPRGQMIDETHLMRATFPIIPQVLLMLTVHRASSRKGLLNLESEPAKFLF